MTKREELQAELIEHWTNHYRIPKHDTLSHREWVMKRNELEQSISQLQEEHKHNTCDGCAMLQNNGCMLDVSVCPDCFEHDQ
jgi:hypothetical protein